MHLNRLTTAMVAISVLAVSLLAATPVSAAPVSDLREAPAPMLITPTWVVAGGAAINGHYGGSSRTNATYRQVFPISATGTSIRIRISNYYAAATLSFAAITVGVRSGPMSAATAAAPTAVTFGGSSAVNVPYGSSVYSDPIALSVTTGQELLISSFASGALPLVSHDFANRTQYATTQGAGNRTGDTAGTQFSPISTSTYWIDAIDVGGSGLSGSVIAIGDSITDGAGATPDMIHRWTDRLAENLALLSGTDSRKRAVLNAGIGGNTFNSVGNPQVGVNGLLRLDRDVLSQSGVEDVIVFAGTNDIYVGSTPQEVIYALQRAAQRIHDAGKRAIISTLIPRGNGAGWNLTLEARRLAVNSWIRSQTVYDAVIDFDAVVRDPANPYVIRAAYDADGTHPNSAGYDAMGDAVDLNVFAAPTPVQSRNLTVLYDFEAGTQGWTAGSGSASVSHVTSFANGPQRPFTGSGALDVLLASGSAGVPKTTRVTFAARDLSNADEIYAWVDAYGGVPGATGYAMDITVRAGAQSITSTYTSFGHDRWNRVAVDVRDWSYRNAVTGIDITYRISGTSYSWTGAHMQVDEVGVITPAVPVTTTPIQGFETATPGWSAGTNVTSVSRVTTFPNGPTVPHGGSYALEAAMANGNASLPKTISYVPGTALNIGSAYEFGLWFDGYGGVPGATGYVVDVTLWSGTDSRAGTLDGYLSDRWSRVTVDTTGWAGRTAITRIDVTYRVLGTTYNWTGAPRFQIDDLHYRS